jgi:hypothetical protein
MKSREFKIITDKESIKKILNAYSDKKYFYIRTLDNSFSRISFHSKDDLIKLNFPDKLTPARSLTIFTLLNNYIELDLNLLPHQKMKHLYKVERIKIAKKSRAEKRYNAEGYNIKITNFTNIKSRVDINPKKFPVYVRVIHKSYEQKYKNEFFPISLYIDTFENTDDLLARLIKKDNRIIYVRDTQNIHNYLVQNDTYISPIKNRRNMFIELDPRLSDKVKKLLRQNFETDAQKEVREMMERMEEEEVKSFLYYPIIYDKNKVRYTNPFPMGYIKLTSETGLRTPFIDEDIIDKLRLISKEICEAVSYGSNKSMQVSEPVIDISLAGLRTLIKSEKMKETILNNPTEEYKFDLQFPSLPVLSFWGEIIHYTQLNDDDKSLSVGIKFLSEDKRNELRLRSIATLENYIKYMFENKSNKKK